eukprot:1410706-Amphidinium_carterae.1
MDPLCEVIASWTRLGEVVAWTGMTGDVGQADITNLFAAALGTWNGCDVAPTAQLAMAYRAHRCVSIAAVMLKTEVVPNTDIDQEKGPVCLCVMNSSNPKWAADHCVVQTQQSRNFVARHHSRTTSRVSDANPPYTNLPFLGCIGLTLHGVLFLHVRLLCLQHADLWPRFVRSLVAMLLSVARLPDHAQFYQVDVRCRKEQLEIYRREAHNSKPAGWDAERPWNYVFHMARLAESFGIRRLLRRAWQQWFAVGRWMAPFREHDKGKWRWGKKLVRCLRQLAFFKST